MIEFVLIKMLLQLDNNGIIENKKHSFDTCFFDLNKHIYIYITVEYKQPMAAQLYANIKLLTLS